jgi:molybdenum cofactor cytidylyltransferase
VSAQGIGIIVLAAGASARMGEPKQLLRYGGETLLRRAVQAARDSLCRPIVVVLGARAEALRAEVGGGVEVVVNQDWAEGLAASIRCGLRALEAITASTAAACVLTLCDQPFVTSAVINRLVIAYETSGGLLVASEYAVNNEPTQGVPALFNRALFAELIDLRGAAGAKRVIKRHRAETAFVAVPEAAFDVDTPADYRSLTSNGDAAAGAGLDVI